MAGAVNWYARCMHQRPLLTQMISSGLLGASGDAVCQIGIQKKTETYDWHRTGRFFINACFWNAPVLSRWIKLLERLRGPSKTLIWKRLTLDQLVFAPVFTGTIVFNLYLLEGKGIQGAYEKVKHDYVNIMMNFYKLWPLVQLINYSFVPLNYRVVFIQSFALLWNVYLSFATQFYLKTQSLETAIL